MKQYMNLFRYLSLMTAIIVILTVLLPVITYDDTSFLGYEVIFGKEIANINPFNLGTIARAWLPFSLLALVTFTLPVLASVLILIDSKNVTISLILSLIGLVMMLILPNHIHIMYAFGSTENRASINWMIDYGLVIATTSAIIGLLIHFFIFAGQNSLNFKKS